ncbi:flagellar hook-length control protein FliK [Paenibacillus terrigena]|uniref:flagellar hook-length control protein FliK n=1 Tax=Paenibacillus terrigena TaxID=369333 RepID=UPI00035F84D3|nr:flagellar hook-length control protein FliK [Paenibacillus terrigena]
MEMMIQSTSASISAKSSNASATKNAAGTDKSGNTFGQVLGQSMNGQEAASGTGNTATVNVQTLIKSALATDSTGEISTDQLIEALIASLQEADGNIENNPDLLGQLQDWIKMADELLAALVSPQVSVQEPVNKLAESDLAADPGTLRFAVQDRLMQLATLVKEVGTAELQPPPVMNKSMGAEFMQTLQSMLGDMTEQSGTQVTKQSNAAGQAAQLIQTLQAILNKGNAVNSDSNVVRTMDLNADRAVQPTPLVGNAVKVTNENNSSLQQNTSNQTHSSLASSDDQPWLTLDNDKDVSPIVTAGQMALRAHDTTVLRPAAPVIQAQNFAPEMSQFIKQLDIVKLNGLSEAKIILFPEHLGQVDIRISVQNGHIVAQFMTEHAAAKDMLDMQMAQLRTALQSQGLQVEKLEVTQNQNLHSQMFHDGRQSNRGQGQGDQQTKNQAAGQEDGSISQLQSNMQEEQNIRLNGLSRGSSFHATV